MNRITWLLAVFLLSWATVCQAGDKLCLWKVTGAGKSLHLLGSIHFLKEDYYPLPEPMEAAFRQAKVVAFETDLEKLQSPATQMKMLSQGMCPPDKTIRDFVSKETFTALEKHAKGKMVALERLQPWMAAVALVVLQIQELGFNPEQGVDQYFHRKAVQAGKKTEGLESVESQLSLFTDLSKADQEEFLQEVLAETAHLKRQFQTIAQAWKTGDVSTLEKELNAAMKDYPHLERRFLTDRNRAWLPKIEELLGGDGNCLIVVGAGHLVGRGSVVELLREKGYRVEQVNAPEN